MQYMRIANATQSSIVINSCNVTLRPKGEPGDAMIISEEQSKSGDIAGLLLAEFIAILPANKVTNKANNKKGMKDLPQPSSKKSNQTTKCKSSKKTTSKKPRNKAESVTYVDRGKIKKGKMSRRIDATIMLPSSPADDDDNDSLSPAFVENN